MAGTGARPALKILESCSSCVCAHSHQKAAFASSVSLFLKHFLLGLGGKGLTNFTTCCVQQVGHSRHTLQITVCLNMLLVKMAWSKHYLLGLTRESC